MKRVFLINGIHENKMDKYLLISGFVVDKKPVSHYYRWSPSGRNNVNIFQYTFDVPSDSKHKLKRIEKFVNFKSSADLKRYISKHKYSHRFLIQKFPRNPYLLFYWTGSEIKKIELCDILKETTAEMIDEILQSVMPDLDICEVE